MNPPPFAEYPRPNAAGQYGRGPGVYFEAIGEAWNLVRKDLGHWAAATIVYMLVGFALSRPLDLIMEPMMPAQPNFDQIGSVFGLLALRVFLNIIPYSIQAILGVGMVVMGVRKARGEYINVGMIFEPFRHFGRMFGVNMLYFLIILASFCACFLPVFYFAPIMVLMPSVAYLRGVGAIEALSLTYDSCKAHWAGLLALTMVLGILIFAGFLACLVGILVAWPVYCVTLAIHYRAFFESEPPPSMADIFR